MTEKLYRYTLCKYDDDALWMDANGALTDFAPVEAFLREQIAMAEEAQSKYNSACVNFGRHSHEAQARFYYAGALQNVADRARALLGEE